jgi:hypothetical protein
MRPSHRFRESPSDVDRAKRFYFRLADDAAFDAAWKAGRAVSLD